MDKYQITDWDGSADKIGNICETFQQESDELAIQHIINGLNQCSGDDYSKPGDDDPLGFTIDDEGYAIPGNDDYRYLRRGWVAVWGWEWNPIQILWRKLTKAEV